MPQDAHKKAVRAQFGSTAEVYSQWATVESGNAKSDVGFFEPAAGDRALDVACGPGTLSLKLAPLVREVVGVDLTEELLAIGERKQREQGLTNVRFLSGDVDALPFPPESFDLVLCGSAMHHFPKPANVLGEMRRVCRSGGRVGVIDIVSPDDDVKAAVAHEIRRLRDPSHARAMKPSQLVTLFEEAGLRGLRRQTLSRPERFSRWAKHGGLEEADPRYGRLREIFERSIEGDRTGWRVRSVDGDLEFDREYFYLCGTMP